MALPKPMRLTLPALETLAIAAYRQPIQRSEVEKIRGVDSGGVLKTLLERRLLRIVGRSSEPGQPLLYGTTQAFLEVFNLSTLKELPTLKDLDDLMRERRAQALAEGGTPLEIQVQGDDEDLTDLMEKDDEDETEVIRRRPLDEDEEEEEKDMEALSDLEGRLKDVRRLERAMFPKPIPEIGAEGEGALEGVTHEGIALEQQTAAPFAETTEELPADASGVDGNAVSAPDAIAETDRPFD
jgi:hypothetical protein